MSLTQGEGSLAGGSWNRRAAAGIVVTLLAGIAVLLSGAAQAADTFAVRIVSAEELDPDIGAPVLDLADGVAYADVHALIGALEDDAGDDAILLPLGIPGVPDFDLPGVTVTDVPAAEAIVLRSGASLNGVDVEASVVVDWTGALDEQPDVAVVVHGDDISLSALNASWPSTSILPELEDAWVVLTPTAHTLSGTALHAAMGDAIPNEDIALTTGATFRAVVDASGSPLDDVLGTAGLDAGAIALRGTLGVDGSVLTGLSPNVSIGASLGLDPDAPEWLQSAAAEVDFSLAAGTATLHVGGTYGIDLGGDDVNTFTADLTLDASSTGAGAELVLTHAGALELPAPLDFISLGDASLSLRAGTGGLGATLHGTATAGASSVTLDAALVLDAGTVGLDVSVVGPVDVADVARLLGEPLGGFDAATLAGLDGISIESLSFSFEGQGGALRFSAAGAARLRGAEASILLSARKPAAGPPRLLAGVHLTAAGGGCCATLGDLLGPDIGEAAAAIPVPTLDLVFLSGSATLGRADLDANELAFFEGVYGEDLPALRPGLSLATTIPLSALGEPVLDLLGLDGDDVVALEGYVGSAVGAVAGSGPRDLTGLELKVDLPETEGSSLLPEWLDLRSDWELELKAVADAVAFRATADIHLEIADQAWDADLVATLEKDAAGIRATLDATLGPWEDPFGIEWFDLDGVHVAGAIARSTAGEVTADIGVEAGFTVQIGNADPKRFAVEIAVEASDTVRASFKAKLLDTISMGDALAAVGAVTNATSLPPQLSGTSVGPVTITAEVGGNQPPAISVLATGTVQITDTQRLSAQLFASLQGTDFVLGVRPQAGLRLSDLIPEGLPAEMDLEVPNIMLVAASKAQPPIEDDALSAEEHEFWRPLYGCDEDDLVRCEFDHFLPSGISGIASFGATEDVQEVFEGFNLDFSQPAMLRGTLPIFGGGFDPNVSIRLPAPRIDAISEFFEDASMNLKVSRTGVTVDGQLAIRMPRPTEGPGKAPCRAAEESIPIMQPDGSIRSEVRCFDVLRFGVAGRLGWTPQVSLDLTGSFTADGQNGWLSPFGVGDWIGVKRLAVQLLVVPSTRTFGIGLGADFRLFGKDAAGSIALGLNVVAPNPPYVIPELIGFRLSSASGLEFEDVVAVQHEFAKVAALVSGAPEPPRLDLAAAGFPNLALRNLDLMYARQTNEALCFETGFIITADLYVNPTEGSELPVYDGGDACRIRPSQRQNTGMQPACVENKSKGCFASIMLSITLDGLLASGNVNSFDIGPIHWRDSYVDMALTLSRQHLALKGGATLDGVFDGDLELALGLQGLKLKGDVNLFNGAGTAYIEADAPIDLANPAPRLSILASLHADFEDTISAAIDRGVAPIRSTAVALDVLWDTLLDLGDPALSSSEVLRSLPQKLRNAGLPVPREIELMITTIADVENALKVFGGGAIVVDTVLNGIKLPDFPGWEIGLIPSQPTCLGWTVQGACWILPPVFYNSYDWFNLFCFCPGPSWVHVPARWDYTFAIPGIVAQPTCVGEWDGSRCWALGLRPFAGPQIPGVCDLTPGLTEADLGRRCTLRDVIEKAVNPVIGQAISTVTGQPAPANLSAFLDQIVGGLKAAGGAVKVECATFKLELGGGLAAPSAQTEVALAMNLFGTPLAFGAAWDFSNLGSSLDGMALKVIDQLINPKPISCQKKTSTPEVYLDLTGDARVDEDGSEHLTGTFSTPGDRIVTIDWGDGTTQQIGTTGTTFNVSHRYVDDDPTGAPSAMYVVKAKYTSEGRAPVAGSRLLPVFNVPPSNLAVSVTPTVEGGTATLSGTFADAGTLDTHSVIVDWGDGLQPDTIELAAGSRTFSTSRPFASDGERSATVSVIDDDTGRTSVLQRFVVTNAAPTDVVATLDAAAIDEGSFATLSGTFADAGVDDQHIVTVDWGDGSAPSSFGPGRGSREFTLGHQYVDDSTGPISVTVTDDAGATGGTSVPITVSNVAPSDVTIGTAVDVGEDGEVVRGTVGEGTEVLFTGSFSDPGTADAHTVTIEWGGGIAPTTLELAAGQSSFETSHHYADDDPTSTIEDLHPIAVTVVDDDGGSGAGTSEITIADVAPTAIAFAPVGRVDEAAAVTYSGSFLDVGLLDTHTVTIDWGDGTADTVVALGVDALQPHTGDEHDPGLRTFEASHTYADDGESGDPVHTYSATVTVVDDDTAVTDATFGVPVHNVAPSALALALVAETVSEHGVAELSGTFDDPGTLDTHTVTVDWGDGSGVDTLELGGEHGFAATHRYLDDDPTATDADTYRIDVQVVDDDTGATATSQVVAVDDVAPSGLALTIAPATFAEHGTTVLDGTFADPGTLDTFTVTVDWGEGTLDVLELGVGERSFTASHQYGDDGTFPITVLLVDDDTLATGAGTGVTVTNGVPTLAIDRSAAQWVGAAAGPTVTTRRGEARTLSARSTDLGSDDLRFTWTWGDGTTSTALHRNVVGTDDPDPSPTVGPRDVTDTQTHTWSTPCLYAVPVGVGDDDAGTASDSGWVVVTDTSGTRRGTGWWHSRFDGRGGNDLPASVQSCYLRIAEHVSAVFGEVRSADTAPRATEVLTGPGSDPRIQLDRLLLSLWLDYADGAFRWTDAVDTDGNGTADAVFSEVMQRAERARLDSRSTTAVLHAERQRLQRTVLPGQRPPAD